jgi:hypothetical protein
VRCLPVRCSPGRRLPGRRRQIEPPAREVRSASLRPVD